MIHFEMLKEIAEVTATKHVILEAYLEADKDKRWRVVTGGYPVDGLGSTPEEAIEAAYEKLFPPIPKKVGCCVWEHGAWRFVGVAGGVLRWGAPQQKYLFVHPDEKSALAIDKKMLQDFLKLIAVNPKLKPPTEKWHDKKSRQG